MTCVLCVCSSLRELCAVQYVFPTRGARAVSVGKGRGCGGGVRAMGYFRMWRGCGHEPPRGSTQHCTPWRPVPHQRREQVTRYSLCFRAFYLNLLIHTVPCSYNQHTEMSCQSSIVQLIHFYLILLLFMSNQ